MYQPQVASWTDQKHIVAYSAVGYEKKGAEKPTLGSVKIESDTSVALDERLVHFNELKITEVNFEKLDRDEAKEVTTEIDKAIPDGERVIGARSHPRQRRQEPDHPEERGGREGRPAEGLLQHDACSTGEHRR